MTPKFLGSGPLGDMVDENTVADHELTRWLNGMQTFMIALNRPATLGQLLNLVTVTACDLLGFDFCGVLLVRPEQRRLMIEGAHGLSSKYVAEINDAISMSIHGDDEAESPSSRAFLTARPVAINDVVNDPLMKPWRTSARQQGYRSLVSVPLLLKGRPIGVLNCYSKDVNGISESSVNLLSLLANQIAAAIEVIHLRDEQRANIDRLIRANTALRQQSHLLEQAEEMHNRLSEVALGAGGLDDICKTLSELINKDINLVDSHGRSIASSDDETSDFQDLSVLEFIAKTTTTKEMTATTLPSGSVLTLIPIIVGHEMIARILVLSKLDDITGLDQRVLRNTTVIIALELLRIRAAQDVEQRVQGEIINALLEGHPSEFPSLLQRAESTGSDLKIPHRLVLISFHGKPTTENPVADPMFARSIKQTVTSALDHLAPRPLIAIHDSGMVLLIPITDKQFDSHTTKLVEGIQNVLIRHHRLTTLAIIGPLCSLSQDFARALRMTRGAALLHEQHGNTTGTIIMGELGLVNLLLQIDQTDDLESFAKMDLGVIRAHDIAKSASLESTLRTYLSSGCNIKVVASELFVHPNTVKMRLRKIENLLGRDLSNIEDLLNLRAAILIADVLKVGTSQP
jgi:sugar diacid utilization regulator